VSRRRSGHDPAAAAGSRRDKGKPATAVDMSVPAAARGRRRSAKAGKGATGLAAHGGGGRKGNRRAHGERAHHRRRRR